MLNWGQVVDSVIHNSLISLVSVSAATRDLTACVMIHDCCEPHAVRDDV